MLTTAIKLIVFERELWRAFSETEELKKFIAVSCRQSVQCHNKQYPYYNTKANWQCQKTTRPHKKWFLWHQKTPYA